MDADLPDERLRVVAVEGDDVRLRVESRNGRSGEHIVVPTSAVGTQLRRVA